MGQSYSITAVLQAIDKNFSSTYKQAEAQAKALEKQTETVGSRSQAASARTRAAWGGSRYNDDESRSWHDKVCNTSSSRGVCGSN